MLAADGLAALPWDARRQCMHHTHSRNQKQGAIQPDQLTRMEMWRLILQIYQEAYPDADAKTKSIVKFGLVVKEKHHDAPAEADQSEHHHII
eukprot:1453604-Karenia_brevis.AAC.1